MESGRPQRRMRMLVAYDGAPFHGFAANPGVATVMGTLTEAVERIVRHRVDLVGAGRTDAGVHAWGQVISGDLDVDCDLGDLQRRINRLCGPHISVRGIEWAAPDFHARFAATARVYRYQIWNDPAPNPLMANQVWHITDPLRLSAMDAAGDPLIGEHDFSSFCRRPDPSASLVRRLLSIRWFDESPLLWCEIRGTAFCHQMVRSLVAVMVEAGRGRATPADVRSILIARDRQRLPAVAPAHGLILWEVSYEGRRWDAPPDPGAEPAADHRT